MKKAYCLLSPLLRLLVALMCLISIWPQTVFAHPVINEFSSSSGDDWVELYNPTDIDIDLSLYRLRDSTQNNKVDLTGILTAKGFMVAPFGTYLNNSGDSIRLILTSDESQAIDSITYGNGLEVPLPTGTQTGGRREDGINEWVIFSVESKGISNNTTSIVLTPTPTSQPTSTPTRTPTPTKMPTPTNTKVSRSEVDPTTVLVANDLSFPSISEKNRIVEKFHPNSYPTPVYSMSSTKEKTGSQPANKENSVNRVIAGSSRINKSYFVLIGGGFLLSSCGILILLRRRREYL